MENFEYKAKLAVELANLEKPDAEEAQVSALASSYMDLPVKVLREEIKMRVEAAKKAK